MEKQEIRFRLALVGPTGSGKSEVLEAYHAFSQAEVRGPLTAISDHSGHTLFYDHAEFRLGKVGDLPLFVDLYALPGDPNSVLARRIILSGCDGYLFTSDSRSFAADKARASFAELREYLKERGRTPETAALVAMLTRDDPASSGSNRVEMAIREHVPADRLLRIRGMNPEKIAEAIKKAAALVLALERDALESRRKGEPPLRLPPQAELADEIDQAHHIYLRASAAGGAGFSPHSDQFLGQVLLELRAAKQEDVEEGLRLKGQAMQLNLTVTLEEILTKRDMVNPEQLELAKRVRSCVEVIHEEVVYGRVATDLDLVPFVRVKRAMTLQAKRHFQYTLDHLLGRAGQLDPLARRRVLSRLVEIHQGELMRDDQNLQTGSLHTTSIPWETQVKRPSVPLFGEVALQLNLVTKEQLKECVKDQKKLRKEGIRRFLGEILRRKGYLSEDEIPLICRALEEKIADDRIEGYTIVRSLGRGNMALVFAARQVNLDRIVALKILDPKLLFDSEFISQFVQEAQAAAMLNHPNIVQAYDVGSCNDLHYFAMEYVDGVTVKDMIEDQGYIDEGTAIDIIVQAARALDHAAKHKLVHRDVKPGNLMITRDGVTKLCDLGLAKRIDQAGATDTIILGSPYYISPEQIEGRPDIDIRADIYSLGATLFHMLTGRPPYGGRTPEDVCLKHLSDPVPDPTQLSSTVTQRITPILFKMMNKNRQYRYRRAADIIRDLLRNWPDAASDERQNELAERLNNAYPTRRWQVDVH